MLTALTRSIVRASARAPPRRRRSRSTGGGSAAARTLDFNTEPDALFAPDLPFRAAEDEFYRLFPGEADVILVVIDGPSPAAAERAADRLAARLATAPALFPSVR